MERLTKIDGIGENEMIRCFDCYPEKSGHSLENCGYCDHWRKVLDRLAAYEDTGLTPEEVKEMAEADKANRLVVLPCKVGDDLWWIDDKEPFVKCEKGDVKGILVTADGFMIVDSDGDLLRIGTRYSHLTKEAAEKALETGAY